MSAMDDGGPAFPVSVRRTEKYMDEAGYGRARDVTVLAGGMTLRDYFAAKALPSVVAVAAGDTLLDGESQEQMFARKSYAVADAMLSARGETK